MKIYVDAHAETCGNGTQGSPFRTIQQAADIAMPGDEVIVLPGIYRENVAPKNAGTEDARIMYRSAEPLKAVITGAEAVKGWKKEDGIWTARVSNDIFTERNPYMTRVSGDWFMAEFVAHTGDVFLNGKSMYEASSAEDVRKAAPSDASWDREFSVYQWYSEQDGDETVFYANFQDADPNEENVEITVRSACFTPKEEGIGYISLSGFTVCQAATQWAPPTAFQEGMIAPHWSKGWIIEDCEVFESKCSGISLGKYRQKGNDNKWLHWKYKDGTQTERECICQAQDEGWSKETVGSHTVRRCNIHDCGQTGIVGHLGGVFSLIEDNHIHHINNKQNLAGAEIGGIKMHAAIDTVFRRNHIHHCTRGLWLDWQAQGTRVTQNLMHDNSISVMEEAPEKPDLAITQALGEDIFVEVSHGPTLIDNNLLLSDRAIKIACQGVAAVHNLIAGGLVSVGMGTDNGALSLASPRYTPYHFPHRTQVAGFMTFLHGDDRFYNNIFIQKPLRPVMKMLMDTMKGDRNAWDDCNVLAGTFRFDGYMTFDEWDREFEGYCGMGSPASDRYYIPLPVWSEGNVYFNGAKPWDKETGAAVDTGHEISLRIEEREDGWYLVTNLSDEMLQGTAPLICTDTLGMAFEPEQRFENPDGSPITFDTDYFGNRRERVTAGPFAHLSDSAVRLTY